MPVPGSELRGRPLEWTARLGRRLREEGAGCTLTEAVSALEALPELDLEDPLDAYLGLKAVFLTTRTEEPAFDRVFWALWEGRRRGSPGASPVHVLHRRGARRRPAPGSASPAREENAPDPSVSPHPRPDETGTGEGSPAGAAWSPIERLARRSFRTLNESELRELDRAFDRLIVKLATRRSRRQRPAKRKGRVDLRRSFRGALRHEGEMLRLARRRRRVDRPRVVLLCDVSGSMERYSRFLVRFLLATRRTRDVETFVFSTRLVRLTRWLRGSRPEEALAAMSDRVPGWSGGTRIGASLEAFLDGFGRTLLGRRTVVVILSDGLDQGDVELLERAMAGIQRRARKVIWLNPLLESPTYRPEARGMKAALQYVDDFASAHSLAALRELTSLIRI